MTDDHQLSSTLCTMYSQRSNNIYINRSLTPHTVEPSNFVQVRSIAIMPLKFFRKKLRKTEAQKWLIDREECYRLRTSQHPMQFQFRILVTNFGPRVWGLRVWGPGPFWPCFSPKIWKSYPSVQTYGLNSFFFIQIHRTWALCHFSRKDWLPVTLRWNTEQDSILLFSWFVW